eukprot:TRINITY_DN33426_c0_g1_i1.p1 TRINITY_DN33426_c0_g1~~TRINITY_DN33426_c0_g1_i1.p1  ORF type:complete len:140 (+),score=32.68 TRINITY_DN33426_c0_g1_i1:43-420(+)
MAFLVRAVSRAFDPVWVWAAKQYRAQVAVELKKVGLRYDDLYDDMADLDIAEALKRLPREVVDARNQRLKRAMDLSMKHAYLSKEMQAKQTPYEPYLQDMLKKIKEERAERAALGTSMPYQRSIP